MEEQNKEPVNGQSESEETPETVYNSIVDSDTDNSEEQPSHVQAEATEEVQAEADETEKEEGFTQAVDVSQLPPELQATYKLMQGDYTRKMQKLAEERQALEEDLQLGKQAAMALRELVETGEDIDEGEYEEYTEDGEVDQLEMLRRENEQLKLARQAEIEKRQAQEEEQYYEQLFNSAEERLNQLAESKKHELSDVDRDLIWAEVVKLGLDEFGRPKVDEAYQKLEQSWKSFQQRWLKSKQTQPTEIGEVGSKSVNIEDYDNSFDLAVAQYNAALKSRSG